jgi:hypothetical protein
MDWLPTVIGIALVAAAAVLALLPLVRGGGPAPSTSEAGPADRMELYRQVLELEFDYQLGKLSSDDYHTLAAELLGQAGASLRDERSSLAELDAEIEREIAAARAAFAAARSARAERPAVTS